ncbi:MAG: hypothetical protein JOZ87_38585 [Chloroflexi bacterium]|nr:hypothetical protein [Chloroflexota bacterium]
MRTSIFALVAVVALLVALAPVASAAPASSAEGAPNDTPSSPTGWYIFHSDDGFHLRTHGPGSEHDFDGVLHTEGTFENVSVVRLEDGDRADVTNGGHDLVIHFHTFDGIDGVNFTIRDANRVRLDLKLDDQPAPTSMIYLGPLGVHPNNNPFHLHF